MKQVCESCGAKVDSLWFIYCEGCDSQLCNECEDDHVCPDEVES